MCKSYATRTWQNLNWHTCINTFPITTSSSSLNTVLKTTVTRSFFDSTYLGRKWKEGDFLGVPDLQCEKPTGIFKKHPTRVNHLHYSAVHIIQLSGAPCGAYLKNSDQSTVPPSPCSLLPPTQMQGTKKTFKAWNAQHLSLYQRDCACEITTMRRAL